MLFRSVKAGEEAGTGAGIEAGDGVEAGVEAGTGYMCDPQLHQHKFIIMLHVLITLAILIWLMENFLLLKVNFPSNSVCLTVPIPFKMNTHLVNTN